MKSISLQDALVKDGVRVMPRHLTEDQVEHFRDAFRLFDTDGGGSIDAEELGACLRSLGRNLSESEIHEMIVQWDLDDKGTISFEGFLAMISSLTAVMDIEKELHSAFQEFDHRQCGKMNKEDFISIFTLKTASHQTEMSLASAWVRTKNIAEKPLTRAVVEQLIHQLNVYDDRTNEVDYELFIRRMLRC